jgi:5-methyltetrahydrofolate--homocysteine methyltransferase
LELIPFVKKPGILNSVSEEHGKADFLFPKMTDTPWKIIALTCDNRGISAESRVRFEIAVILMEKAEKYGISADRIFIDPLVTAIATAGDSLASFTEAVTKIKNRYPAVHITGGLSNISFGMPSRRALNQQFLALAMEVGMDSAIMDPCSRETRAALYAAEALLGRDKNCRRYLQAYRAGTIGRKKLS